MRKIEWVDGVSEIPRDDWNALVGGGSPFLEWDWLASMEQAGVVGADTGWVPKPLVVREEGQLIAACPLYLKGNSEGEFVFDHGWAEAAQQAGIDYYPKLLVGVPFTPVTGGRFLILPGFDRTATVRQLADVLQEICLTNAMSGVHINFCEPDEVTILAQNTYDTHDAGIDKAQGRCTDTGVFQLRVGFQYHWHNAGFKTFEDYLARFRSKRRNQIRRERRELARQGISIEVLTGDAITEDLFDPMFRCYLSTVESHYWGRQYLNPRFFELLGERFRHRMCLVVARRDGAVIAGTTNVLKGNTLYGRYWGALQAVRHLHFNVCYYRAIEHCIETGIERFEPGAGGDYKYLRGFDPEPTYSLHFLANPHLAQAVAAFLDAEREQAHHLIEQLRAKSALKTSRGGSRQFDESTRTGAGR